METLYSVYSFCVGAMRSVSIFILVMMTIVIFHEMGHYLVAKMFKVRVEQFSVGFGKAIFSRRDENGVEWRIGILPLGGYVKIFGFDEQSIKGSKNTDGAFVNAKLWQKFLIVIAGPAFNYILAFALLFVICVTQGKMDITNKVHGVAANSPAAEAGIVAGDRVIKIGEERVTSFKEISALLSQNVDTLLSIEIERGEAILHKEVHFHSNKTKIMGLTFKDIIYIDMGVLESIKESAAITINTTVGIGKAMLMLFKGDKTGVQIGGIGAIMNVIDQAMAISFIFLLKVIALLSINLGFFNLLPIPALDGGHLFHYIFQFISGGRVLPLKVREVVTKVGVLVLVLLMLFATWNDIKMVQFQGITKYARK